MNIPIQKLKSFWEESNFQLDIPIVDMQHIWLLSIIVRLEELLKDNNYETEKEEIKNTFNEVLDYVSEHFSIEEMLISQFYYPESNKHVSQHRKFVKDIMEQPNLFFGQNPEKELNQLLKVLRKWLFTHIKDEDRKYKIYLTQINADLKSFTKDLIEKKFVTITQDQSHLYNQITRQGEIQEIVNENMAQS